MSVVPWEKQIAREADWWFEHHTKGMALQCHVDFFEHIYFTYGRPLFSKQFEQALEIGPGASGGYLGVMPNIVKRIALDPICEQLRERDFLPYEKKIRYIEGFAEDMPFGDKSFDLIIVSNALDHVKDMEKSMKEIERVIADDGYIFFFTFLNVGTPHPHTFKTTQDAMDMFAGFTLIEGHTITETKRNNFMRARSPYFVGVFKNDNM